MKVMTPSLYGCEAVSRLLVHNSSWFWCRVIKSVDKGKRYKRRKSSKEFAGTGLDFEEVKSAFEKVNTGGIKVSSGIEEINAGSLDVNTGIDPVTTDSIRVSVPSPDRGRREGKAPMTEEEETQASRKTKEQILQEEAGLAEAIRLDALEKALEKEEVAKQVHLDSLIAQRMAEEQELTEEQKKRKAQVQFEAQSYTEEDWDTIRAKLEANAELKESVLGKDLTVEDYAKRMVELVNQRRKHFAEERARAKRNKPMTQTQLRNYMSNFLKNQGTWKLTQLKKLNFEEVKAEFEKLVKQLDTYVPMNFEATKESLKRFGEELQTKTAKKLKFDDEGTQPTEEKIEEDKDDKPTKKTGKRRKQIARKGFHTDHDRDESEDSDEANEKDDSTSGTKIPINPVPVATKSPSIANYKIIKQGRKGVYQIVRENGTDMVYISFGAMLTDISRDDLTELYRIVMKKHGMNEPEDEFEKVLWEYLKNMFEEPLSTDSIWSLPGQQRIICWRYYDACRVHCLNLESADVYMLIERKYPLSAEVCKAMLDKKLQGGKPDEDCYKLLKMMEKQAELTSPEQTAIVEMVFSRPWTCTFLEAKGLTTPELMANPTAKAFQAEPIVYPKYETTDMINSQVLAMLSGESYTYRSHDEAIPYGNDGGNVGKGCEDVTTLLRNGSAAENAALLMQEKGASQPKKPRHPLTSGTVNLLLIMFCVSRETRALIF
ncbi:hypothetical protein Tco_0086599 [Tanacetum coccineum]